MIPMFAVVRFGLGKKRRGFGLWLPLFLVWLFLLPLVLLLLPFFCIACWVVGMQPFKTLGVCNDFLSATRGTQFEVSDAWGMVLVTIR